MVGRERREERHAARGAGRYIHKRIALGVPPYLNRYFVVNSKKVIETTC
jgi:hypothetical protein